MIEEIIIFTMCLILLVGCIVSLLLSHYYNSLIFASENMGITNNIFFKQLKLKYENLYKFQLDFCNTQSFIKKQIYKLEYHRLPLYVWDRLLITLKYISAFIGSFSIYLYLTNGYAISTLLPYIALTILTYVILSILSLYISADIKRDILITNLQEYIENYLNPRLSSQLVKEAAHANKESIQKNNENKNSSSSSKDGDESNKEVDHKRGQAPNSLSDDRTLFNEIQSQKRNRDNDTTSNPSSSLQGHDSPRQRDFKLNEEIIEKILMEYI
jgi:hypothetical protein